MVIIELSARAEFASIKHKYLSSGKYWRRVGKEWVEENGGCMKTDDEERREFAVLLGFNH